MAGWSASCPQARVNHRHDQPWLARWAWDAPFPQQGTRRRKPCVRVGGVAIPVTLSTPSRPAAPPTLAPQPSLRVLWGGGGA